MYNCNGGVNEGRTLVFSVYNLTRSPLTAALYYLNAWKRLCFVCQPANGDEAARRMGQKQREKLLGKMYALNFKDLELSL